MLWLVTVAMELDEDMALDCIAYHSSVGGRRSKSQKMKGCEGGHVSARNEEKEHVFVDR